MTLNKAEKIDGCFVISVTDIDDKKEYKVPSLEAFEILSIRYNILVDIVNELVENHNHTICETPDVPIPKGPIND